MKIAAVILAAGHSRRMGTTKALLPIRDKVLLTHIVATCRAASIERIIVVVGSEHDEGTLLSRDKVESLALARDVIITVGSPDGAQLDSLRCGVKHVPPDHACFLWPVDHPFADAQLLRAMHAALVPGHIVLPTYQSKHGHPVLLGSDVVPELLRDPQPEGARSVLRRDPARIIEVEAVDPRVTRDLDTPGDARELLPI